MDCKPQVKEIFDVLNIAADKLNLYFDGDD